MKTYTIGEITRLGLLKNHKGKPYRHKATVAQLLRRRSKRVTTLWGKGYAVTQAEIDKLNSRWQHH